VLVVYVQEGAENTKMMKTRTPTVEPILRLDTDENDTTEEER
jgi:hypothetical protein